VQYAEDRRPKVSCHDRYLQMADSGSIRGNHGCELAGFAHHQIRLPIVDDLGHCWERRLGIKAAEKLSDDDPIGFLEAELGNPAEDLAYDVRSRLIEGQVGETRSRDSLGEANRRGYCGRVTCGSTGPGERDERAEVPGPSRRREQDAHDATLSRNARPELVGMCPELVEGRSIWPRYPQIFQRSMQPVRQPIMITKCPGSTFVGVPMTLFTSAVRAILNTVCSSMAIGCAEAYTKTRRPFSLVWAQECDHIEDAYVLEHRIKGWRREKKIALIEGRFGDLPRLSSAGSHKQVEESS